MKRKDLERVRSLAAEYKQLKNHRENLSIKMAKVQEELRKLVPENELIQSGRNSVKWSSQTVETLSVTLAKQTLTPSMVDQVTNWYVSRSRRVLKTACKKYLTPDQIEAITTRRIKETWEIK